MVRPIGYRSIGVVLLIAAITAVHFLRVAVLAHAADIVPGYRFELSLLAVIAGFSGSALLVSGSTLFESYQWPPSQ
jgi:hypothetical protein